MSDWLKKMQEPDELYLDVSVMPEFQEGIAAYKAGKPASKNPYKDMGNKQHIAWLAGWNDIACDELIERLKRRHS